MSLENLYSRIRQGEIILLDGATGSEIEKRGVDMDESAWCGVAHMAYPDVVRSVHEDYILAGSDIIIANTFGTSPHILEQTQYKNEIEQVNRLAVRLAQEARDMVAEKQVYVAGSMSSVPAFKDRDLPTGPQAKSKYMDMANILAEAGVDLIITEMMMDLENAAIVVEAAVSTGLPVWVGFSSGINDAGAICNYLDAESYNMPVIPFADMAKEILSIGGEAAGIMHTAVNDIKPSAAELVKAWNGPVFAYAESGYFESPSWKFVDIIPPENYASIAEDWCQSGIHAVGGCCGTGPDHIRELRRRLCS